VVKKALPANAVTEESIYEILAALIRLLAAAPGIDQTLLKELDRRVVALRRQMDDQRRA